MEDFKDQKVKKNYSSLVFDGENILNVKPDLGLKIRSGYDISTVYYDF